MKTAFFMALLTVLFMFVGGLIGGRGGMMFAFIFAIGMNFFSYWFSDKIVLKMYKAVEVDETEAPGIHRIVRNLTTKGGIPMPKVYVIHNPAPNAFATGRNPENAAVAVTTGIVDLLNDDELEGVLAHELAHIYGRDILIGTIAATFAGAIMMIANTAKWAMIFGGSRNSEGENSNPFAAIAAMIIAPIAAMMIQMAISRSREYIADARGAKLCGKPKALANALRKISGGVAAAPMDDAQPATAHMFIMNPFSARQAMNLFSTHPPVEERIARLEAMQG
ncbi:zinc metalloprotease HtpX [Geovibrio ferrireducens]|uniref:zinc metalloprotease HtpX n=1 Tax=Geovibrio ferrireducens TaxID=46201 RepID=UPI002247F864|nr:zinc metalloprotease HtpX [Geovibrio ferrireducens]